MNVWKRKCQRCLGSPILTVVVLLLFRLVVRFPDSIEDSPSSSVPPTNHGRPARRQQQQIPEGERGVSKPIRRTTDNTTDGNAHPKAAILILAPQRNEPSMWGIDRFCFLRRAVRSIDQHLNAHFGPYPIYLLIARDYDQDPTNADALYTPDDRALLEAWAPHSSIIWQEVDMYSEGALEPGANVSQIIAWGEGEQGGIGGRPLGYRSMCRLWSGRVQNMAFLDEFEYYMRMDDDALLTADLDQDPFVYWMQNHNLTYMYRRQAADSWGIHQLWAVAKPHVLDPSVAKSNVASRESFLREIANTGQERNGRSDNENNPPGDSRRIVYSGRQPYNNFHIARVDFWRSPRWRSLMRDMDDHHLFFQYRVGDANVHAMALLMMGDDHSTMVPHFPYAHNSNDLHSDWGKKEWQQECNALP
jgi:hypothetical protein